MDKLYLVKATEDDCKLIFDWANEKEVRKNSFNSEMIKYEDHVKWFNKKINSENVYFYIAKNEDDIPVGTVRLEKEEVEGQEDSQFEISISVDSNFRGKGYATIMFILIKEKHKDQMLFGKVKKDNIGSIKALIKAGYYEKEEEDYLVFYSKKI